MCELALALGRRQGMMSGGKMTLDEGKLCSGDKLSRCHILYFLTSPPDFANFANTGLANFV